MSIKVEASYLRFDGAESYLFVCPLCKEIVDYWRTGPTLVEGTETLLGCLSCGRVQTVVRVGNEINAK